MAGKNISYEILNLPQDLANDFTIWQDKFDEHGIKWDTEDDEDSFYQYGLELAKRLKEFFSYKAYIEYEGHIHVEIKYFYVMAEYGNVALWDDEGSATNVNLICEEFGINFNTQKLLEEEFDSWGKQYERQLTNTLDTEKYNTLGKMLAKKLEKQLPTFCKIGYNETLVTQLSNPFML